MLFNWSTATCRLVKTCCTGQNSSQPSTSSLQSNYHSSSNCTFLCANNWYVRSLMYFKGWQCTVRVLIHWTHLALLSLSSSLMCRTAEEVPWQLQRADLKKELYHIIISVDILVQLYAGLANTTCSIRNVSILTRHPFPLWVGAAGHETKFICGACDGRS